MQYTTPINISILNTEADEFAPSYNRFENQLYYNSNISGYSQFYITKSVDTNYFDVPKRITSELNEKYRNQSYITFANSNLAFLSSYRLGIERSYLNLFQTENIKKSWIKPFLIEGLTCDCFCSHPSISDDGSTLIFSSNRNSTDEDTDLWIAYKNSDGSWGNTALLSELNSSGNEITPFLKSNDTLYFASDGLGGLGGYDLFVSIKINGVWQSPIPLSQLNTEFDESDLIITSNNSSIIFASNRAGGKGGLDLYISYPEFIQKKQEIANSEIELSIATQTNFINITNESTVSSFYLPNIVLLTKKLDEKVNLNINELGIETYDKVLDNTLNILLYRIISTNSKGISLLIHSDIEDGILQNSLKKYLVETLTKYTCLDTLNIQVSFIKSNKFLSSFLKYPQDRNQVFITYELLNDLNDNLLLTHNNKWTIEPSIIELFFDSRPRTSTERINYNILLDNKIIYKSDAVKSLPEQKLFDLSNYKKEIWQSDSLVVFLDAYDNHNMNKSKKLIININKVEKGKKNSIYTNRSNYDVYDIILSSIDDISSKSMINFIKSLKINNPYTNDSIQIVLLHPSIPDDKNEIIIEKISNLIKEIYSNRVEIQVMSINDNQFKFNHIPSSIFYKLMVKN